MFLFVLTATHISHQATAPNPTTLGVPWKNKLAFEGAEIFLFGCTISVEHTKVHTDFSFSIQRLSGDIFNWQRALVITACTIEPFVDWITR